MSLHFSAVQQYASKKVAKYLSKELKTTVTVDGVYFSPFNTLELKNISVDDRQGKKMIAVKSIRANLSFVKFFDNKISVIALHLDDGFVNYEIYKDSTNFSFLVDYFNPPKKDKGEKPAGLQLDLHKLKLQHSYFKLTNHQYKHHNRGVDFSDLELTDINGAFEDINITKKRDPCTGTSINL